MSRVDEIVRGEYGPQLPSAAPHPQLFILFVTAGSTILSIGSIIATPVLLLLASSVTNWVEYWFSLRSLIHPPMLFDCEPDE